MPPIYHVCNDRLSSIIGEGGKIPSASNAWSIASISEIYEMEIHDLFMSIWVRLKCTADGDPPHVTLAGVAAHDVLLSPFLPPGKRLWTLYLRNKSIGFTYCIWKPVVYMVQYYIHFATGLMLKPK